MENILNLVKALNAFKTGESVDAGIISIMLKGATDKDANRYFGIKKRPVADKDGVQTWKFVARQSNN